MQRIRDRGPYRVDTLAWILDDLVARAIDEIGIVPEAARHRIIAGTAIDDTVFIAYVGLQFWSVCSVNNVTTRSAYDVGTRGIAH